MPRPATLTIGRDPEALRGLRTALDIRQKVGRKNEPISRIRTVGERHYTLVEIIDDEPVQSKAGDTRFQFRIPKQENPKP